MWQHHLSMSLKTFSQFPIQAGSKYRTTDIHAHKDTDSDTHAVLLVLGQSCWKLTFSSGGPAEADDSRSLIFLALLSKDGQRSQIESYNKNVEAVHFNSQTFLYK